ncbi:uncharacterized protein LAESUDRAFT_662962, partial [Laetiporus sulphureus 93-53]
HYHELKDCRTLNSIIRSCVVTTFTRIWGAIHSDVPNLEESSSQHLLRHIGFVLCAVIAPELYVWVVAHQWVAARQMWVLLCIYWHQKLIHALDPAWTCKHGFFLLMGGFAICKEEGLCQLFPQEFSEKLEKNKIVFLDTTKAEIKDRSKANFLSKVAIVIQTGWFLLQIITRQLKHLMITPLELATVAFTSMTFAMYFFWFHKLLDVTCPVILRRELSQGHMKAAFDDERNVTEKGPVVGPSNSLSSNSTSEEEHAQHSEVVEVVGRVSL